MVVVDDAGKVEGVISLSDIIHYLVLRYADGNFTVFLYLFQ